MDVIDFQLKDHISYGRKKWRLAGGGEGGRELTGRKKDTIALVTYHFTYDINQS